MARVDASMSTFLMVHNSLCMLTIGLLGSEAQKRELLPSLASLEAVGADFETLFSCLPADSLQMSEVHNAFEMHSPAEVPHRS